MGATGKHGAKTLIRRRCQRRVRHTLRGAMLLTVLAGLDRRFHGVLTQVRGSER